MNCWDKLWHVKNGKSKEGIRTVILAHVLFEAQDYFLSNKNFDNTDHILKKNNRNCNINHNTNILYNRMVCPLEY